MPRAVINYGHGPKNIGYDPGAIGPTGYKEATQNAEIGTKVVAKLKANSWDVLAIQDGDLFDVTNQSNSFKPDAFISIHADSFTSPSAHGITTYALSPGGKGEAIAKEIQRELVLATGLTDRGVKFSNLHVLRETKGYPAVLVEIGFISNPAEEALMKTNSFDEIASSAICKGFSRALGYSYVEGVSVSPMPVVVPVVTKKTIAVDDVYLSVRVRESLVAQAIIDINKLGLAAKRLDLA